MNTVEKALKINLDPTIYGTIAEIGAGQEVARNFFIAGGAAGTIAKSMSAYDMKVSDAIYGEEKNKRYVVENRVRKMIDREYGLLIQRLEKVRSCETRFFSFANTVAAKAYKSNKDCHGWFGLKFQLEPAREPNEIVLHVRMKDNTNNEQQVALGVLGINLIYAAFYHHNEPEKIIDQLDDGITDRVEVNMIRFSGPRFKQVDNRLMALQLVKSWLTRAVIFTGNGEPIPPSDLFYKKNVLLLRGSFRPFTRVHQDILDCGSEAFLQSDNMNKENTVFLTEISMSHLISQGNLNIVDYLGRIDILTSLGYDVMISDYVRLFRLKEYLRQFTKQKIGIVSGIRDIKDMFTGHFYEGLTGGLMHALGMLFNDDTQLYAYPKLKAINEIITLDELIIDEHVKYLYQHLLQNKKIVPLDNFNRDILKYDTRGIRDDLKKGPGKWQEKVPEIAAQLIAEKKMFGYGTE